MRSSERQGQWSTILDITRTMAALAEDQAWEKLAQFEAQRRRLLGEFFASPAAPDEAEQLAAGLHEMLALDKRIIAHVTQAQDQVGASLRSLYTGRQANQAYAKASA